MSRAQGCVSERDQNIADYREESNDRVGSIRRSKKRNLGAIDSKPAMLDTAVGRQQLSGATSLPRPTIAS